MKNKERYIVINVIVLLFICLLTIFIGDYLISKKEKELLEQKYSLISKNLKEKSYSLIESKKNATLALTLTLSENEKIKNVLLSKGEIKYELNLLSEKLKNYTDFRNVWFQMIDKDGVSIYRSWTEDKNDKIKLFRSDLHPLLKSPKIQNNISVGIYDITFKSQIPIYNQNNFLGVLEGITHFNSITKELKNSDLVEAVLLVEKKFTEQLRKNSFTNIFLKDYYVANFDSSKELLKYLENQNFDNLLKIENYFIKDGMLITNVIINQDNDKLANMLLFRNLNSIDISEINQFKKHAFSYLTFFLIVFCLTIFVIGYYLYSKRLRELNQILQQTVNKEILKNDEKNKILFQQNKMAAMGEMIENIAHQWRQPLSVITTAASSIKLKKEYGLLEDKEYEESMNYIIDTANYLSNTIDDFRYYFSPNKSKNLFNSKKLVEKAVSLLNLSFNDNQIEIIKNVEDLEITSFENELLQVIINILNNAQDELIKKEKDEKRYIFIDLFKENDNLKIKIKDNAGGIKEEIKDRIFEPYFTTKHKSKGTGIGLYMCEEIIIKHIKGKIEVSNEKYTYNNNEFVGALFKITVPLT
ncbi:MAG: HAMP domain-containing histidine kinase [Arcobacter sp.]|nr:HAMP domain-containing histidine kinase [Arcobacter sp.]